MRRCTKCILPKNYPGITFNEGGACNYCIAYKEREYMGGEVLKKEIISFLKSRKDRNKNYDCVVGISGGRDSSYLLYYLVKKLNLRALAYSVDNGFIPKQTKLNMENMCDILKTKLVIEEQDYLKKCLKHHILSWMSRPTPAMIGVLCTGCRLGMTVGLLNFAKNNKIPLFISGGTPFEGHGYKTNIMKNNPNGGMSSFVLGYSLQIIRNPRWILNSDSLITQIKEFYYYFYPGRDELGKKMNILKISPFHFHIKWEEKEVISTIKNKLKWRKTPGIKSTWRGDCEVAMLRDYLFKKTIGFNDKDDGLSGLVMDKQISRKEALERLDKEEEIPEKVIKDIFDKLELDYSDLKTSLSKYEKNNN